MPPAARVADLHACPAHGGGPVLPACEPTVIIGYSPAARVGDKAACAGPVDAIAVGEPSVIIGDKDAARQFDATVHGGKITTGCFTVIIGSNNQVETLRLAAMDGTPFCEECEKAAEQAEQAAQEGGA
ncbi:MAG: PAAR domain-containing protein [Polyangiaceae bacterium]